ncbi:MAG TPA: hypothetical protein VNV25_11695 [Gemmatimonadaceae bacterium]|nr:hypothetical protein [Gemmatimonadaceae bacterium]
MKYALGFKHWCERRMVEKQAVCCSAEQRARTLQLRRRTLELARGRVRINHRQRRERRETARVCTHGVRDAIIGITRDGYCRRRVQTVHPESEQRQHLHIDPGSVHISEPAGAQIGELALHRPRACWGRGVAGARDGR